MSRTICVSGACQTGGIIDSLRVMLPSDQIVACALPSQGPVDALSLRLAESDVWATSDWTCLSEEHLRSINPDLVIVRWPQLFFPAFHPDLSIVLSGDHSVTSMGCTYNSALIVWSWKHQIAASRVAKLFSKETFKSVGYLSQWNPSVARLRNDFVECELDFDQFFLPVKRQGAFMHSNLHAKLSPIVHISRQLAIKLGAKKSNVYEPIEDYLADPLIFDAVWPVYPDIGDHLGIESCYRWKYRDLHCSSLKDYIDQSYSDYDSQPIDRNNLFTHIFSPEFDAILERQLEQSL